MNLPITKYPYEKFPIYADFYVHLDKNETLSFYTLSCVNRQTGTNSKSSVIDSDSLEDLKVKIVLKDNSLIGEHKITVKAKTSNDNDYEIDIPVRITNTRNVDRFRKQPSEAFIIAIGFSNDLTSSETETISSSEVSAIRLSDGSDLTSSIIELTQKSSSKMLIGVMGGVDDTLYRIIIKVVTSAGYKFQKNITMKVQER